MCPRFIALGISIHVIFGNTNIEGSILNVLIKYGKEYFVCSALSRTVTSTTINV
jgi:hypothetical protein